MHSKEREDIGMKVTTDNLRKAIGLADLIASRTVVADVHDGSEAPADISDPCENLPFD